MPDTETMIQNAEIIRSRRKTVAMQISDDGRLVVRAPLRCSYREIYAFIEKNRRWIEVHAEKVRRRARELEKLEPFTAQDITEMTRRAGEVVPERVRYYAALLGVTYGRVTIRHQKSKWGSCTSKGNLNFNCLLMAAPPQVLDSVVVHELCHRLHMDHSRSFYAEVYRVFPEYDRWHGWLRENGALLIRRMTVGVKSPESP
jgi:predicted metal-dependent hydrolase